MTLRYLLLAGVAMLAIGCQPQGRTQLYVDNDAIYLLGTFDEHTYKQVLDALDANTAAKTIAFTANGGSIDDESVIALGRELRRRGVTTHLVDDGVIASGGVTLFLSGANRAVGRNPLIGVHSWQHCWSSHDEAQQCEDGRDVNPSDDQHELHGSYTEEMLGSRSFYWYSIHAAPSSSIHWMRLKDIHAYSVAGAATKPAGVPENLKAAFESERKRICGKCRPPSDD